ncbi:MAG: DUF4936 family protein [Burkholderiales bacterium]|nr:DUF4936 family protein [Burkholderiales bacterium]
MPAYFIYYRLRPETAEAARAGVNTIFAAVRAATGVSGRLLTKRGEAQLWMEIYEPVAVTETFERTLQQAVDQVGFDRLLAPGSVRKLECFVD